MRTAEQSVLSVSLSVSESVSHGIDMVMVSQTVNKKVMKYFLNYGEPFVSKILIDRSMLIFLCACA